MTKWTLPALAGAFSIIISNAALAQEEVDVRTETVTYTTPEPAKKEMTDHDKVVNRFGIGMLGSFQFRNMNFSTPVVGMRYWTAPDFAIEFGLGLAFMGGKETVKDVDRASNLGVQIHIGFPFALASSQHFTFEMIPYGDFYYEKWDQNEGGNGSAQGFGADVGLKIGGEVQFGFIGIPELSLTATVGAGLGYENIKLKEGDVEVSNTNSFGVRTTVDGQPWDIFTSSIAALYYF